MTNQAFLDTIQSPKQKPVLIGLFNISERSKAAIEMVLKSGGLSDNLIVNDNLAQVVIIDIDGGNSDKIWHDFRQRFPEQLAIVLSVSEPSFPDILWVQKPVKPATFLDAIAQSAKKIHSVPDIKEIAAIKPNVDAAPELISAEIESKSSNTSQNKPRQNRQRVEVNVLEVADELESDVRASLCGSLPEIIPKISINLAKWFYEPELHLQGVLTNTLNLAHSDNKARVIECGGFVILVFPGSPGCVMTTLSARRLRSICFSQMGTLFHAKVRDLIARQRPILLEKIPLENFQWLIALASASGRLPADTNLHLPVKLERWPNFTRVQMTPHAMQITALWLSKPMSLLDTALHLDISQRYVFSLYSAANAIGIASIDNSLVDSNTQPDKTNQQFSPLPPQTTKVDERKGFLARLLAKLKQE